MCTKSLCAEIVALCADIHRAEYRLLTLIEELDTTKPWRHEAMPSCAHWLNAHCGLDLVTAREKVRIAHALPRLPLIRECFRSGELSYSKVRAITRVAGWDNEAELVEMARANTAAHVARNVASMRQAERLSDSKAAFDSYRHRTFACRTDDDGTLVFEGRLPADQGAVLIQALDRAMDWLIRGGREWDDAQHEALPQTIRRADALAILAERFLSEPPEAEAGLNTADRFQVTVHASAEALLEHSRRRRRRSAADRRWRGARNRNVAPHRVRQRDRANSGDRRRRTAGYRSQNARHSAVHTPCVETPRPWLSISELYEHALRRWSPHHALGGRRRDAPRQPRAAVSPPSSAVARRDVLRREGRRALHLLSRRRRRDPGGARNADRGVDRTREESVGHRAGMGSSGVAIESVVCFHRTDHDLIGISQQHVDAFEAGAFEQACPTRNRQLVADPIVVAWTPQRDDVVIPENRIGPRPEPLPVLLRIPWRLPRRVARIEII